jgi:hypothetical protein
MRCSSALAAIRFLPGALAKGDVMADLQNGELASPYRLVLEDGSWVCYATLMLEACRAAYQAV